MTETLIEIFKHNLWANEQIVEYCRVQPDALLDGSVPGTYGTVRDTLKHLVRAEENYARRLAGGGFDDMLVLDDPFPGFEDLLRRVRRSGQSLIDSADRTTYDRYVSVEDEGTFEISYPVVQVQAINHATEHRAHIMTTLSALGAEPIEIDSWAWGFASGGMTQLS